jgi:DNA-binding CsgD family transcriptional regulator
MASGIVGRDEELAWLRQFVGSVTVGPSTAVLEGDVGVGKTTLWLEGVAEAETSGFCVLDARPGPAEGTLSFSTLGDLLDPVLEEALVSLPSPQRNALARALLLEEAPGPPPDPHAVGVATLNSLRALADSSPLVVAIDDVQWLDAASAAALAYAARRLRAEPVGLLVARRSKTESNLVTDLRSFLAERFHELEVGPVEPGVLRFVIQAHLGLDLPRPLLAEVHDASGGNPLYALEIVRTLPARGTMVVAGQPLPVPESLRDLVQGRLLALPPESRKFLLAAAVLSHPTVALVESATGVDRRAGLGPALDAQVVELEGDRIMFTHPLLSASVYQIANLARRREVHARLAQLVDDPEARGRHLAASVDEPDEAVAAALDDAARSARGRGALRAAALLLERARDLTPRSRIVDQQRRAVDAARLHFESGDSRRARAQLEDVLWTAEGSSRARALETLARVRSLDAQAESAELFLEAIENAEGEPEILAAAHEGVATCLLQMRERLDDSLRHAGIAVELALKLGDEGLAAEALGTRVLVETLLGLDTAAQRVRQTLALQRAAEDRRVMAHPLVNAALHAWWTDDPMSARRMLLEMLQRAQDVGDESSLAYVLVLLGLVESVLGELSCALLRAQQGAEAAAQSGQEWLLTYNLALESLVEALRGREQQARGAASRALALMPNTGGGLSALYLESALGHLELTLGHHDAAEAALEPAVAVALREQIAEPAAVRFVVDYIEALVALGRRERALQLLGWYEENARRLQRGSAIAACLRCRGLLAAQAGAVEDALAAYEKALEWHGRVEIPLDVGRTLLALGAAQRRAKRRREARTTLEAALGAFEQIGAALWAQRARDELRRISGRAPSGRVLTPAEERVAELVAEGKTNREVAAALFLSQRTVEGHLSRVFGKLGITHRAELAHALGSRRSQGVAASNTSDPHVSHASFPP